ncbi:CHRD domain-containing protein [Hymenobacter tenuis]
MKTTFPAFLLLLFVSVAMPACNDDDDDNDTTPTTTVQLQASLTGQQEVPATPSSATGTFSGSFDKVTRVLTYTVSYQGLAPSAGHIHQGAPGINGGVLVPFSSVATSPITGTATLTEDNATKLLAGETYVNLHTPAYPGGEIRGNITGL